MTVAERPRTQASPELSFLAQYRDHLLHELAEVQRRLTELAPSQLPQTPRPQSWGLES